MDETTVEDPSTSTDRFIEQLSSQLTPVKALPSPARRAAVWLLLIGLLAAVLIVRFARLELFAQRMSNPRVGLEWIATVLTAICAIVTAFQLTVPGAQRRWLWLPLIPFALWLSMSGLGCLKNGLSLHGTDGFIGESGHCFGFIIGASVPLAAVLFAMLRRARPIAPLPVAAYGTLGVAATAASVLQFFHPFDVTVIDLTLHLAAVGVVFAVGTALRRGLLNPA